MKRLSWIFVLLMPFFITACLDDSDDDDDNPDADSGWSAQNTGVTDTDYRMIPANPLPTADQITNRITYVCAAITAEDDAIEDDSKMVSLHFDANGVAGSLVVTTFLGDTVCDSGNLSGGDLADVVYFDHVLSSKGDFVFNRIDITVTGFAKKSLTTAGANALNAAASNAGSCGKADWGTSTELSLPDTSVCTDLLDRLDGFMLNNLQAQLGGEAMPVVVGTVLEGVQTWAGDIFTFALGVEGSRPQNVETTLVDDGYGGIPFINGAPAFSRY